MVHGTKNSLEFSISSCCILNSVYHSGEILCRLIDSLLNGIHVLIGADVHCDSSDVADTFVTTRTQSRRLIDVEKDDFK